MEEKLRRKFILVSISVVSAVIIIIAGFINLSNHAQIGHHADEILNVLVENNGHFPKKDDHKDDHKSPHMLSPEDPFSTRFFTATADKNNNILYVDTGKIASTTTKEATEYTKKILAKEKSTGYLGTYKYVVVQKDYGKLIIYVDCSRDFQLFYSFLRNSIFICIVGILAVLALLLLFSKKAIAPIVESYEKQKKFITDANHELKTPLAIISANTEVIEMDYGQSQWTDSTKNQINRLSQLITSLVSLSRMDEEETKLEKTDFSISDAVLESAEPYYTLAKNNGKKIVPNIEKNITLWGNEKAVRQLVTILLDNAIKYANPNTEIILSLKKQGKKIILETINEAENLKIGNYDILFERFYRQDTSRNSKTGGYGVGLSIAKAICEKHKCKITAESPDGKLLCFKIIF